MATAINNPSTSDSNGGGMAFLVGIILVVVVVFLFFYYGLPVLRGTFVGNTPQVNVPSKIDVNVNENK